MDALAEEVELLDAVDDHDQLAVEDDFLLWQREDVGDDLGEVAVHRLAVAALEGHVVAVAEHDRAEAVPLRLEAPALALRQLLRRAGELGLDRRLQRKGHGGHPSVAPVAARGSSHGRAPPGTGYDGRMSREQATAAEEEYLQTIYWLEEAQLPITGANVAPAMQVSAPTVHEMVGRLENDGYITRAADKSLEFTSSGRSHAAEVVKRHRLIERFLTDVLGIPWDEVHEEAERLEHAMSPVLEERMRAAIGDARTCPHGHPIEGERETGVPLADVEEGAKVLVLRFEHEAEDLLHYLMDSGIHPGFKGTVVAAGDEDDVTVEGPEKSATITRSVAETVAVRADPSPPPRAALASGQLVFAKERYGR